MTDETSNLPYEDIRRAGLNPATDYGGSEQRVIAGLAIREAKEALGVRTDPEQSDQLSLLSDDSVEINPEAVQQRAVIGSRALKNTVRTPEEPNLERRTARERAFEDMARVEARKSFGRDSRI